VVGVVVSCSVVGAIWVYPTDYRVGDCRFSVYGFLPIVLGDDSPGADRDGFGGGVFCGVFGVCSSAERRAIVVGGSGRHRRWYCASIWVHPVTAGDGFVGFWGVAGTVGSGEVGGSGEAIRHRWPFWARAFFSGLPLCDNSERGPTLGYHRHSWGGTI